MLTSTYNIQKGHEQYFQDRLLFDASIVGKIFGFKFFLFSPADNHDTFLVTEV